MDYLLDKITSDNKLLFCLHANDTLPPIRQGLLDDLEDCERVDRCVNQDKKPFHRDELQDSVYHPNDRESRGAKESFTSPPRSKNQIEAGKILRKLSVGWFSLAWYTISSLINFYMIFQLFYYIREYENEEGYYHTSAGATRQAQSLVAAIERFFICEGPRLSLKGIDQYHGLWLCLIISLLAIGWRVYALIVERDFHMDLVVFLLLDSASLERNIRELNEVRPKIVDKYLRGGELDPIERALYMRVENYQPLEPAAVSRHYRHHRRSRQQRQLLEYSRVIKFFIRPNRTPRAKRHLKLQLDKYFKEVIMIIIVSATITSPLCVPSLIAQDHLPERCRVQNLISFSFLWKFCASGFVSLLYWAEVLVGTNISLGVIWLIKEDLLVHWSAIVVKIRTTIVRLSCLRSQLDEYGELNQIGDKENHQCRAHHTASSVYKWRPEFRTYYRVRFNESMRRSGIIIESDPIELRKALEVECLLLRAQLSDFFSQVRRADKYVGLLSPFTVAFSQVMNVILTFTGGQFDQVHENVVVRCIQVYGFIISSITCIITLEIKHHTDFVYGQLCTLMALDASSNKLKWMPIIDIFNQRRNGFSVFHGGLFTWLLYLKVISYTLTVTMLVENLRHSQPAGPIRPSLTT